MKTLLLVAALLFPNLCFGADPITISPDEAGKHLGEAVVVKGVVSQVSKGPKAVFVNFGGTYPNHAFTAVSFNLPFSALSGFEGKTVNVSGPLKDYNGKPEIVVSNLSQIAP